MGVEYCRLRLAEDPHLWASTLHDELAGLRFAGSYPSLAAAIRAVRERDARVYQLRVRGWTLREIGDELGFASISGHSAINRARAELVRPAAEHQRDLACDHLDALTVRAWSVVEAPGPVVSGGRLILGSDGRPLVDQRVALEALRVLVAIDERRARLSGSTRRSARP